MIISEKRDLLKDKIDRASLTENRRQEIDKNIEETSSAEAIKELKAKAGELQNSVTYNNINALKEMKELFKEKLGKRKFKEEKEIEQQFGQILEAINIITSKIPNDPKIQIINHYLYHLKEINYMIEREKLDGRKYYTLNIIKPLIKPEIIKIHIVSFYYLFIQLHIINLFYSIILNLLPFFLMLLILFRLQLPLNCLVPTPEYADKQWKWLPNYAVCKKRTLCICR